MPITAHILQQAIHLYLQIAYANGPAPEPVQKRIEPILALPPNAPVPQNLFERDAADCLPVFALRLGQPLYPFMKLVVEPAPVTQPNQPPTYLLRVDTHDRHLHAAPGTPDAAWLAAVRASNREVTDKIEAAWSQARLPTFKDLLRQQLEARKAQNAPKPNAGPPTPL